MYLYTAYGLNIRSELELPELVPAESYGGKPDVTIRFADFDQQEADNENYQEAFLVQMPEREFLIRGQDEVLIGAVEDGEESLTRLLLLGPTMAALLRLRGLLVLHASAVATPAGAIIFLGDAGYGKSTIAEFFYSKGYPLVADDVVAIEPGEEGLTVLPGFPQAKLWPDAASSLGYVPETLPSIFPRAQKRSHRLDNGFSQHSLPLRKAYVLGPNNPCHEIEALEPRAAFLHLIRFSRSMKIPTRSDLDRLHFYQCKQLLESVSVSLLKRQRSLEALPNLVSLIEEDLALSL